MRYLQRKARSGQTTAEYAIIVALVAVCSIAIIMIFGNQIRNLIGAEAGQLAGNAGSQNTPAQGDTSQNGTNTQKSLNQF
jgi:Flp pilus assembly pilin Flp